MAFTTKSNSDSINIITLLRTEIFALRLEAKSNTDKIPCKLLTFSSICYKSAFVVSIIIWFIIFHISNTICTPLSLNAKTNMTISIHRIAILYFSNSTGEFIHLFTT